MENNNMVALGVLSVVAVVGIVGMFVLLQNGGQRTTVASAPAETLQQGQQASPSGGNTVGQAGANDATYSVSCDGASGSRTFTNFEDAAEFSQGAQDYFGTDCGITKQFVNAAPLEQ